jgi:hypothetical protein
VKTLVAWGISRRSEEERIFQQDRSIEIERALCPGSFIRDDECFSFVSGDSNGSFGQFAQAVICGWIRARRASGADSDKTASTLLGWMDDDPYSFCYEIEEDAAASGTGSVREAVSRAV